MATASKTGIRFREGIDAVTDVPREASENNLSCRFAVIQETYRPDMVDMYFDEALCRQVLDFARGFAESGIVEVIDAGPPRQSKKRLASWLGRNRCTERAQSIDEFLHGWLLMPPEDREPPRRVVVRNDGQVILCIATEFWALVGGPPEYHDSYTYSVFSRESLSEDVRRSLLTCPAAQSWHFISAS